MPKRTHFVMVSEDDPSWIRFWNAYEKRSSKKDARKAWAELNPSPELVDQICTALAWQFRQPNWVKENHSFAPLPATYLRGERWTDEPPRSRAPAERECYYGHHPPCQVLSECRDRFFREARDERANGRS